MIPDAEEAEWGVDGARKAVSEALGRLVGLSWWGHGRLVEMADFHFGGRHVLEGRLGYPRTVGDYALHIQGLWRLRQSGDLLLTSDQVFDPVDEDRRWDVANKRDLAMDRLLESGPFMVEDVAVSHPGRGSIVLDNDLCLDLGWRSDPGEVWRLLVGPGRMGPHFVVERLPDGTGEVWWD